MLFKIVSQNINLFSETTRSRAQAVLDLASQIDELTNSISGPDWGSTPATPVPSLPCSPNEEVAPSQPNMSSSPPLDKPEYV